MKAPIWTWFWAYILTPYWSKTDFNYILSICVYSHIGFQNGLFLVIFNQNIVWASHIILATYLIISFNHPDNVRWEYKSWSSLENASSPILLLLGINTLLSTLFSNPQNVRWSFIHIQITRNFIMFHTF
jgi:hypothetical protein